MIFVQIVVGAFIVVGMFHVVGVPPVTYWFHCRQCERCRGVGFVRKDRA